MSFEDIFTNLRDLPYSYPDNMARESLSQMARQKNTERMAARRRAEAERTKPPPPPPDARVESSPPAPVEETIQIDVAETEPVIDQQEGQVTEHRGEKRPAEHEADYSENLVDKQPRVEESDLASGRIAEIGRHQHDAIEHIGFLTVEAENEKDKAAEASLKAESEAMKAAEERARASAEADKAKTANQLRLAAEQKANASKEVLKLANETIAKLEANLEESKRAMANAESEISKSFQVGKNAALENYVKEMPKFENRGFKHGWFKALAAANVVSEQPILYEQVDIEPLESNPED
ncbi:uncharacterized protein F44E2.3-like [Camellia sinensis]|uniref:uncharacterized protein F44E2.3-like n=1 Tax=Camellia sinensis TaxID=4442 RepID=UPI001035CCE1|nr:uncharacterized protein F44E2.3-like [Camellia sinensis]